jgi:hypothetical protein
LQTFFPSPDIERSIWHLDPKRRWNQINECKALLHVHLEGAKPWSYHPACKMWNGHSNMLLTYAWECIRLVKLMDGREHPGLPWPLPTHPGELPSWVEDERFRHQHKANLVRKDPAFYKPRFPSVQPDDVYVWPLLEGTHWRMREKRVAAKNYLGSPETDRRIYV